MTTWLCARRAKAWEAVDHMRRSDSAAQSAQAITPSLQAVGARIRALRYERRMTQAELGRGRFSVSYISAVERGAIRPSLQALDHLATTLQVPVTSLLADATMLPPSRRRAGNSPHEVAFWDLAWAQVTLAQGDPDAALTILNGLRTQTLEPAEQVQRHHLTAECHLVLGQHEATRASAARGVRLAEAEGDHDALARLLMLQAQAYRGLASPDLALDLLLRALDLFARITCHDPVAELDATLLAYEIARQLDRSKQAADLLEHAQHLAAELGAPPRPALMALAQAQQAIAEGDWVATERFLAQAKATLACEAAGIMREQAVHLLATLKREPTPTVGTAAS